MPEVLPPPIIDVEASGFGSASYPIEVGLVLPGGDTFCSLIMPAPNWRHWDESAEKVHGVSRDVLLEHGRPAFEVAREVNGRLRGMTVYCDSWYHDFTWLSRLFDAGDSAPAFQLEDIRSLLNQQQADNWQATKNRIIDELNISRHRASNDACVLQATLQRVRRDFSGLAAPPG
jgi:hypothetical protein